MLKVILAICILGAIWLLWQVQKELYATVNLLKKENETLKKENKMKEGCIDFLQKELENFEKKTRDIVRKNKSKNTGGKR